MAKYTILFKNGFYFEMEAENINVPCSAAFGVTEFRYTNATRNIPIYLDVSEIVAVMQKEIDDGK